MSLMAAATAEREFARDDNKKRCYISPVFDTKLTSTAESSDNDRTHVLADGNVNTVSTERSNCTEVLFQTSFFCKKASGFHVTSFLNANAVFTGDTAGSDRLPKHHGDLLTGGEPRGDLLVGEEPGDSGMTKESSNLDKMSMDVSDVKVSDEKRIWINFVASETVFQALHPDTGAPLYEERVTAVREESNLHFEDLRDATDAVTLETSCSRGVQEFSGGGQNYWVSVQRCSRCLLRFSVHCVGAECVKPWMVRAANESDCKVLR